MNGIENTISSWLNVNEILTLRLILDVYMYVITAEIPEEDGEDLGLHLKLLSMLDNPAVIVAAAASGDVGTLREFLRKHPSQVCNVFVIFWVLTGSCGKITYVYICM